ncbi:MAG: cell division protein ZapD [Gammaproteobacteria bacterium]|nr:cell division protein ZapD [Gammaproteobacteria bacterium]
MTSTAEALPTPSAAPAPVLYEQPLAERMRTFLRLEALYQQFMFHVGEPSPWSTRAVVASLLDMVTILNRGDVRNDVLKELDRQLFVFDRYQNVPSVDDSRLKSVLRNLRQLRDELMAVGSQYLHPLRENEFLSAIRHRSGIPGGACEFDLPEYSHWLRRPYADRVADIERWVSTVRPLCNSVAELLWLVRESTPPTQQVAVNGAFHHVLSKESATGLLRVGLPPGSALYPEISGSHHRFTMRFMQWSDTQSRPVQTTRDVRFQLTMC